jgi:hypothetical protein
MRKKWRGGIEQGIGYFLFRHSHGGIGKGSAHKLFFASRASLSSLLGDTARKTRDSLA